MTQLYEINVELPENPKKSLIQWCLSKKKNNCFETE